jgi:hypothetical protein
MAMTKDEATKLEDWIVEDDEPEWTDENGMVRRGKRIRFTPDIVLRHDGQPINMFDMREGLAIYLRRIAAYLEA